MNQKNTLKNNFIKISTICLVFVLGIGYILFSYNQVYESALNQDKVLLSAEKEEISIAFNKYNQYLNLIESRLSHSLHKKEMISRILMDKVESIVNAAFPIIVNLEFIPTSTPNILYTRLGTTLVKGGIKPSKKQEGITHLEKGMFRVTKFLYDEKKKTFGILISTFSISHLLYKYFSENDVHIFPENDIALKKSPLSFKATGLPYIFVIDRSPPSFWQFIFLAKLQIMSVFILGMALLALGVTTGAFFNKKMLLKQRSVILKFKEMLKNSEEKNIKISHQLFASENLLKFKDQATKVKNEIFIAVYERYKQMATQAQCINLLTSKLILEEARNDKLLKEIHSISQEGTSVLRQLVSGFPMKEKIEEIDVLKSIEKIKMLFLPEIVERNIQLIIKGKIKTPLYTDQVIFEITLHNIFNTVIERLLKDNNFQIELSDQDPFEIIFYDNGYDAEEKLQKVKNISDPNNILWLDKIRLKEFINYQGWDITFQKGEELLNLIKLSIPRNLKEKVLPSNVISLFDHRPYVL